MRALSDRSLRHAAPPHRPLEKNSLGKTYKVLLNGSNILADFEGSVRKMGFFTTRVVEAPNASKAIVFAVSLLRSETKVAALILNDEFDPPIFIAQEVQECATISVEKEEPGLAWYLEETDDNEESRRNPQA